MSQLAQSIQSDKASAGDGEPQGMERKSGCRFCGASLSKTFVDLGMSPLCESVRSECDRDSFEIYYPLHVMVCENCWLVQLREYVRPQDIFSEYAYFSSNSVSWLKHARQYSEEMISRFRLDASSQVVEIASNDGYLLKNFVTHGIPALGIEPAANVARVAIEAGIECEIKFFGCETARDVVAKGRRADLLLGNNVLAHVPDINDFVGGMKILLAADGVVTMEFPHLLRLIEQNQFDTIYHEHFSYLSLLTTRAIFEHHGLKLFDVQELATHGGSLRVFAAHADSQVHRATGNVDQLIAEERARGLDQLDSYAGFRSKVEEAKLQILKFFLHSKEQGRSVVGYGAPGKGVTLLNYCGIRNDFLSYTVDRNVYKQGTYFPGTGIPILAPEKIFETRPDYVFILPWNLRNEIMEQMSGIREWGGHFVIPIPTIEIC